MVLTNNWQELFRYHINVGSNRLVPFVTYAKINTQNNVDNYSLVDLKIESYEVDYSSRAWANGCSSYLQGAYQNQGTYYFGTKTVQTHQIRVNHNQEGNASVNISSSFNGGSWGSASGDKTVNLPQIPRGSKITNTQKSFDLGSNLVILNITKYVDTYYDVLNISMNNTTLRTVNGVNDKYIFNPTDAELETIYNSVPNNDSQTITFTLTTYSNSDKTTQIGVASVYNITGKIVDANPTLTGFDYEDTNPLTLNLSGNSSKIINGYSTLKISNLVANANKGATLKLVQINNVQYPYDSNFTVSIPNWSGNVITMYVFDSRNNSTKLEVPIGINYIDYKEKVIINKSCTRYANVNEESNLSFSGEWFNSSFGTYNNQLSASYRYKQKGGNEWVQGTTNINITVDGNTYSYSGYIKGDTNNGFATENSYEIEIIVTDSLSSKSDTTILIAGEPAMDIYHSNISIGGYYNENDSNYQAQFKKPVNFYGGIYKNGVEIGGESLPIGSMIPFGSQENIPSNWKICDGSEVSRTTYADLFTVIGTSYGAGDGSTTFNLPNKRGRVSVGLDSSQTEFSTIGKKGGEKTHQLKVEELPSHAHTVKGTVGSGGYAEGVSFGNSANPGYTSWVGMSAVGGNQPHNNLQPYEIDVWIIKVSNLVSSLENKNANVIDNLTSTSTTDALSANMGKELNEKIINILKPKLLGAGPYTSSGTLNNDITNYNYIIFDGWLSNNECATGIINIETFELNKVYYANLTLDAYSRRIGVKFTSNTAFTVIRDNDSLTIKNIYGIGKRN